MTRAIVVGLLVLSLVLFPASVSVAGLPQWVGCHKEAVITQVGDKINCVYDESKVYQRFSYWVRSYGGDKVCRVEIIELRHQSPQEPATVRGLRDPDSLRRFYRTEYANTIITVFNGSEHKSYIDVMSGPDGYLIEILTIIPAATAPTMENEDNIKQAMEF